MTHEFQFLELEIDESCDAIDPNEPKEANEFLDITPLV